MSNKRQQQLLIPILPYFLAPPPDTREETVLSAGIDIIPNPTPTYPAHLKMHPGTIYLLPTGMVSAFKKPVLFLRAKAIEAVRIHSFTSRTFDFEVQMKSLSSSSMTENDDDDEGGVTADDLEGVTSVGKDGRRAVEFGMVDKKEFGRVETWIAKSGIRDRSMSEDLKAKDKGSSSSSSSGANSKKREHTAEDACGDETGTKRHAGLLQSQQSQQQHNGSTNLKQKTATATSADNEDDDEDFAPESGDDGSLIEEHDSGAEGSDSDTKGNTIGEDSEDDSDTEGSSSGDDTLSQKRKPALDRGSGGPKGAKGQQTKESCFTRSRKGKQAEEDSEDMDMDDDEDDDEDEDEDEQDDEDEEDLDDENEVDELMED